MKYVVLGIPGVGKTSVVKGVIDKTGVNHIHWGNLSKKIAMEQGLIENIDELRKLDVDLQRKIKMEVSKEIEKLVKKSSKDILIETHAAIQTTQGYMPGFTLDEIQRVRPDVFLVIEASPEMIFQRRLKDGSRWRKDDLTILDVKDSLAVTRQMAMTFAVLATATVYFVENKEGDLDYAVHKIVELIEAGRIQGGARLGAI